MLDSGATRYTTKLQTDTGTYDFAGRGATLWAAGYNAGAPSSADIMFGNQGTIFLNIANLSSGAVTDTYSGTNLTTYVGGQKLFQFLDFTGASPTVNPTLQTETDPYTDTSSTSWVEITATPTCFIPGTLIETEAGPRPVEVLRPGDRVRAVAGASPRLREICWIGDRRIDLRRHPKPEGLYPVRISKDALGTGLPARDLLVSPDHCLLIEGQLIPAKLLVNCMTIAPDRSVSAVHYYHIELDKHDAVLAEGVPAETYLDTGNRGFFANTAGPDLIPHLTEPKAMTAWQARLCAPLRLRTEEIEPIWQRFYERAKALGYREPTRHVIDEPDVRLVVGDREFRPVSRRDMQCTFVLPPASGNVRIVSRSSVPTDIHRHTNDWRRLGVGINKIVVRSGARALELAADHPSLRDGWHPVEQGDGDMWRWTTGDAKLPIPAPLRAGSVTVDLYLAGRACYLAEAAAQVEVAA